MSAIRVDAKVVMLGKESVGKTSLVERYVHHRFLVGPYQNVSVSSFHIGLLWMKYIISNVQPQSRCSDKV